MTEHLDGARRRFYEDLKKEGLRMAASENPGFVIGQYRPGECGISYPKAEDAVSIVEGEKFSGDTDMRPYKDFGMQMECILTRCLAIVKERRNQQGGEQFLFNQIAELFNDKKGENRINAIDVIDVLRCVKKARLEANPSSADSLVDYINYTLIKAILLHPSAAVNVE